MIRRVDLRGRVAAGEVFDLQAEVNALVPRAVFDVEKALDVVRPICLDVRHRGLEAIREYGEKFDHVRVEDIRVPAEALKTALEELDPEVRNAFEESIRRVREVSQDELTADIASEPAPGGRVTQRFVPVQRVGLYVPGGRAPLASSVLMNVVPAQVAGVPSLAVASPPQKEFGGLPHPTVLAVCALLGIEEVYAMGGAQAIAGFAYGFDGCKKVNLITGPGNIYVVAAKRFLLGEVGIDSEAGPTEIAVLADDSADPKHVAADLISQAEHDPMAASVLVTPSESLVATVETELLIQVPKTKHQDRVTEALKGQQSAVVLVDDLDQGTAVVDAYAAEHLEIQTVDAEERACLITNAGAIFVGSWSPVSLGDYCAGSNHVLPTAGCACHSSGLSVRSFLKAVHVINYSRDALHDVAGHVVTLAHAEDLPAHGAAVSVRFPEER
ncbi:histidinol dehydrogenase [Kribbella sp. VKM Ac-2566]|uniref:histidinol dehydrogenase n=1 Tax=Kribbella sp. VKM Ac-2566 TaxID=2512218 RepID=UPI0010632544|nr:histidinol dehydrogenase [Kribbella sp. VKM Ac-2566]TDX02622.1 histidinol dehydrogenase [Kribbella sp. VKM Ac-2566]